MYDANGISGNQSRRPLVPTQQRLGPHDHYDQETYVPDLFDAVVLLSAAQDVILNRVERRTMNDYGKSPLERAMILDDLANIEPLLRASCTHELDASRPLDDVVADLIAIASGDMRGWSHATVFRREA